MPEVVELYRHPVKSFTPERVDVLRIVEGRVKGDRVLAFRFADKGAVDDWAWQQKTNYVVLVNTPEMSRIELSFDDNSNVVTLRNDGELLVKGSADSDEDRLNISEKLAEFVSSFEVNPLVGHPERLPLKLIGDGRKGVFHDSVEGGITLHSTESLEALERFSCSNISTKRFRTNVLITGCEEWEELSWASRGVVGENDDRKTSGKILDRDFVGQDGGQRASDGGELRVLIGEGEYRVVKAVPRCLATHANPAGGGRDLEIMDFLVQANGIKVPTFGVRLEPVDLNRESTIRVGDSVVVRG